MSVQPIPAGFHSVTPYLIIKNAAEAIEFYKSAFGATELLRLSMPGGGVAHAEIQIGDSPVMLADEHPQMGALSPDSVGGTPVSLMFYCDDVDAQFEQAVAAGAIVKRPIQDQFYGDRSGTLQDPYGHMWTIGTHVEEVSMEEIERRFAEMMQSQG